MAFKRSGVRSPLSPPKQERVHECVPSLVLPEGGSKRHPVFRLAKRARKTVEPTLRGSVGSVERRSPLSPPRRKAQGEIPLISTAPQGAGRDPLISATPQGAFILLICTKNEPECIDLPLRHLIRHEHSS